MGFYSLCQTYENIKRSHQFREIFDGMHQRFILSFMFISDTLSEMFLFRNYLTDIEIIK